MDNWEDGDEFLARSPDGHLTIIRIILTPQRKCNQDKLAFIKYLYQQGQLDEDQGLHEG